MVRFNSSFPSPPISNSFDLIGLKNKIQKESNQNVYLSKWMIAAIVDDNETKIIEIERKENYLNFFFWFDI